MCKTIIKEATEVFVGSSKQGEHSGEDYNRVDSEITKSLRHHCLFENFIGMSSSATILNDCENGDCVQQPSSSTGVPSNTTRKAIVAPRNATTAQASRRQQRRRKRSLGSISLARRDGRSSSSDANLNIPRSRRTNPRKFGEDNMTTADRAISDSPLVRGTSDIPLPPRGRRQESRNPDERPGSRSARADGETGMSLEPADREPGSGNTTTTQASERPKGNRKRSYGSRSLARVVGQPSSSEANANPTRSRRTTPRRVIEDDEEPGTILEAAERERGASDARVTEDDLTPAENDISDPQLLRNLGQHLSMYARAGQNPPTKGLSFRGAWRNALDLYRAANYQYKQLFVEAGFGDFLTIDPVDLPQGYLIALTERWFPETNTLHLPCCELGPTPLDWTMITGLRFGGQPIKLDPEYKKEKVQELLGLGKKNIFDGSRIRLSQIRPTVAEVADVPPTREAKERIFRRLFLYVIGGCFFGNSRSMIHCEFLQFLEDIAAVKNYDWGAITYAALLTAMRRKVTKKIGSFTAFWQFLLFWAFEYLKICRPEHAEEDRNVFPRAKRWKFAENPGTLDNSELTASRFQLDYVDDETQVTWKPYPEIETYAGIGVSIALAKRRVRFLSLDTWEYYLGERCRRQLGLPCLVPHKPPEDMHRQIIINNEGNDDENIERSDERADPINVGISAETLVRNDIVDYASWFANNSIGKIVDATQLIGGPDIGRKVVGHWMATHQPGMTLVPESEVKEITEALDTAKAEREKLREELSRVGRGSHS